MAKKSRQTRQHAPARRLPRVWLLVGGGIILIAIAAFLWTRAASPPPILPTPQVAGAPRLAVDRTAADEGSVKFGVPVRTTFRLSNVGDLPLTIFDEPQVELVTGC